MLINHVTIEVVRGSVIDQDVDAIVNAANTSMRGGGGVDGAIHRAAGKGLMLELMETAPHGAKTGTAVMTTGHALKQPYVIHTPGPVWNGGKKEEAEKLASCYRTSLELAEGKRLKSIAFCSISTGVYRFPIALAAPIAIETVLDYVKSHPNTTLKHVVFAMFGEGEYHDFQTVLRVASDVSP